MPEALVAALATPGLVWIGLTYLLAGVVRGFTGFGTALIVVPVAGIFLGPAEIILMIAVSGVLSNLILIPDAWGDADRGEVGVLALAAILGAPLGVFLLTLVDPLVVRWVVTGVAAVTLGAVMSGWQYRARLGKAGLSAVGAGAGVVGGLTALTGPVAIMFYLANARKAVAVRANMILFLAALDVILIANILIGGLGTMRMVWVGLMIAVPYLAAITVGKALFNPTREGSYRAAAYTIVALAVVTGLPIWE